MQTNEINLGVKPSGITIDFKALFMELLDKALLTLIGSALVALITFILCSTVIPLSYESTTIVYVNSATATDATTQYANVEVGTLLTSDYLEILESRDIIEPAIEHFQLDTTYDSFVGKVNVENPTDTRILEISVDYDDPYMARDIAIYIRDLAIEMIKEQTGTDISVIQEANLPDKTKFAPILMAIIVFILVFVLAMGVIAFRYILTDKIVTSEDIERHLGVPVLGTLAYERRSSRRVRNGGKD